MKQTKPQSPIAVWAIFALAWLFCSGAAKTHSPDVAPPKRILYADTFKDSKAWTFYGIEATAETVNNTPVLQTTGDGQAFLGTTDDQTKYGDFTVEGDISVEGSDAASGFIVRASKREAGNGWGGYYACLRKLGAGYTVVQLFRFPNFVLLQEARVRDGKNTGSFTHLKVSCKGTSLWIWAGDERVPALIEFDDTNPAPGFVGLKADSKTAFANVVVSAGGQMPRAPLTRDWSDIKGAVFITSESVNSYQMWEEYHPQTIERELSYARKSGLNTVQVYLNFLMWQKFGKTYLARIEDFLKRADKQGLQVTFIFFDDVGNIEPPHLAPYAAPTPGIHNSQMQGSPGRDIVDNHYAAYRTRLRNYVKAVVNAHKNDKRILFWQTYNEPSHVTTLPLLADAYQWIKETGSPIPISATGGGAFYGSYYSDFPTFHSYLDPNAPPTQTMVLGDGGPEHLCTETLDRPSVDVPKLVDYFARRKTGWIIWELMIGRDNCRFPWGNPKGAPEPAIPFHGLIYPDGHLWSAEDINAIRDSHSKPHKP